VAAIFFSTAEVKFSLLSGQKIKLITRTRIGETLAISTEVSKNLPTKIHFLSIHNQSSKEKKTRGGRHPDRVIFQGSVHF